MECVICNRVQSIIDSKLKKGVTSPDRIRYPNQRVWQKKKFASRYQGYSVSMSNRPHVSQNPDVRSGTESRSQEARQSLPGKRRRGRWLSIPPARRMIFDVLYFSKKIPTQVISKEANLWRLSELKKKPATTIGWSLLFLKAYAILSSRHRVLRQIYMRWPWPHFYEHPTPVGRMTVSRFHDGHDRVFFARFTESDSCSLLELQEQLELRQHSPIQTLGNFRRQVIVSRLPFPLRRLIWWLALNVSPLARTILFGTFSLTTVSGRGATCIHPPSLATTTITYGPINNAGEVRLAIVYDHRVMDGALVADFLVELENILNGPIADELEMLIESEKDSLNLRPNHE